MIQNLDLTPDGSESSYSLFSFKSQDYLYKPTRNILKMSQCMRSHVGWRRERNIHGKNVKISP